MKRNKIIKTKRLKTCRWFTLRGNFQLLMFVQFIKRMKIQVNIWIINDLAPRFLDRHSHLLFVTCLACLIVRAMLFTGMSERELTPPANLSQQPHLQGLYHNKFKTLKDPVCYTEWYFVFKHIQICFKMYSINTRISIRQNKICPFDN